MNLTSDDFTDVNNQSIQLPQFVIFMGMFVVIICLNGLVKIYIRCCKENNPTSKLSIAFNGTRNLTFW